MVKPVALHIVMAGPMRFVIRYKDCLVIDTTVAHCGWMFLQGRSNDDALAAKIKKRCHYCIAGLLSKV